MDRGFFEVVPGWMKTVGRMRRTRHQVWREDPAPDGCSRRLVRLLHDTRVTHVRAKGCACETGAAAFRRGKRPPITHSGPIAARAPAGPRAVQWTFAAVRRRVGDSWGVVRQHPARARPEVCAVLRHVAPGERSDGLSDWRDELEPDHVGCRDVPLNERAIQGPNARHPYDRKMSSALHTAFPCTIEFLPASIPIVALSRTMFSTIVELSDAWIPLWLLGPTKQRSMCECPPALISVPPPRWTSSPGASVCGRAPWRGGESWWSGRSRAALHGPGGLDDEPHHFPGCRHGGAGVRGVRDLAPGVLCGAQGAAVGSERRCDRAGVRSAGGRGCRTRR